MVMQGFVEPWQQSASSHKVDHSFNIYSLHSGQTKQPLLVFLQIS